MESNKAQKTYGLPLESARVKFARVRLTEREKLSPEDQRFLSERKRLQREAAQSERVLGGPAKR